MKDVESRMDRIKSVNDDPCESFGQIRIQGVKIVKPVNEINCCWICEGWT